MRIESADEGAQRGNAAAKGRGHPGAQKLLCRRPVSVPPEEGELVLEDPDAVNTAVGMTQTIEGSGLSLGTRGRMSVERPTKSLDRLALLAGQSAPLLLADLVDGVVQRLGDVEVVDDEGGVRAVVLDRLGVGAAHVATGPADLAPLVLAQGFGEEPVDGFAPLSGTDPDHASSLQIIDNRGEFAPLAVGDLVGPEAAQSPDGMSVAGAGNDSMQQVRDRRAGHVQDLGGGLLRHAATEHAQAPFEPVGDACVARGPGNLLLHSPVRRALDLPGAEPQHDLDPEDGQVLPAAARACARHDPSSTAALRAAAAVLVGLDRKVQFPATILKRERGDLHAFYA